MASVLGSNGTTHAWAKLRARVLRRDAHTCHYCGDRANSVDHIIPRAAWPEGQPGVDDMSNLVAACKPCNSRKGSKVGAHDKERVTPKTSRQW